MSTEYEQRAHIMELIEVLDKKRVEMMEVLREMRDLSSDLMGRADKLMKAAADTNPAEGGTIIRKVRYTKRSEAETPPETESIRATSTGRTRASEPNITRPPKEAVTWKRACSICHKPGHRATNPKFHPE